MRVVKARYAKGKIELPADLPDREPCEVTVLFPDEAGEHAAAAPERFRRAAGAWRQVDTEALKKRIYEARSISHRPRPTL